MDRSHLGGARMLALSVSATALLWAAPSSAQGVDEQLAELRRVLAEQAQRLDEQEARIADQNREIAKLQADLDRLPAGGDGGWILLAIVLSILIYLFATGKLQYR